MTINEAIKKCNEEATRQESIANSAKNLDVSHESIVHCKRCATEHRQLAEWLTELKEAKLLLKKAIDDFKELDKDKLNGKCMMPSMDCACCPLNWDSVDDKAEPCHNWRYTNEALKIIGEANVDQ